MKSWRTKITGMLLISALIFSSAGCQDGKQGPGEKEGSEGNEIVAGEAAAFTSYDPIGTNDGQGFTHYSPLVYETLVRFEDGEAVSGLAERWENDQDTWTFYLRKGVTFSDGAAFNAEAVKLNLEKLREYCGEMISYFGGVSRISAIDVLDEYTVRLIYAAPYYAVLQDFSAVAFGMLSPRMFTAGNNPYGSTLTDTAGTGPYVLKAENCAEGKSYTFTRNDAYYNKEGITGPESFVVKIIPDPDSRMMAMQSGEIDLLYGSWQITYDMFDYLKDKEGIQALVSDHTYATRNLLMNTASVNLGDIKVRQAIEHGINKQEIVDTVLHGIEQKADVLFPKKLPYCDIDLITYDYDPALAGSMLDEAGWTEKDARGLRAKDGETLTLHAVYMSERSIDEQILMAFKGQMAELGIGVEIQGYEAMTWYEKGMAGEFDITVNDTYGFPQDPHVFIAAMIDYGVDNPAQQGLAQKPEIDRHVKDMLATVDEVRLRQGYAYILRTLQEEAVNVPVSSLKEMVLFNSEKIKSVSFSDNAIFIDIGRFVLNDGAAGSDKPI